MITKDVYFEVQTRFSGNDWINIGISDKESDCIERAERFAMANTDENVEIRIATIATTVSYRTISRRKVE